VEVEEWLVVEVVDEVDVVPVPLTHTISPPIQ